MGQSKDNFVHYPRTPHLFNPKLLEFLKKRQAELHISKPIDDKMLSKEETKRVLDQPGVTYVWESKIDGTNVGISFDDGKLFLQNRGHELTTGEHPQYSLFRNWAYTVLTYLQEVLGERYILFGEWLYALHTVKYTKLPHYFFEFDIWDKQGQYFFGTAQRFKITSSLVDKNVLMQVPIVKIGKLTYEEALALIDHTPYYGEEKPEGVYLKIEKDGKTIDRYKLVRPDFVQSIIEGEDHWSHKALIPQGLAIGADIMRIIP